MCVFLPASVHTQTTSLKSTTKMRGGIRYYYLQIYYVKYDNTEINITMKDTTKKTAKQACPLIRAMRVIQMSILK